jgi:hypothetical protein
MGAVNYHDGLLPGKHVFVMVEIHFRGDDSLMKIHFHGDDPPYEKLYSCEFWNPHELIS